LVAVNFLGETGSLEGDLYLPDSDVKLPGVVVCHPHPMMGGDMHNNVVIAMCRSLFDLGIVSLRFNFRGVGDSSGSYDGGAGEALDATSAVEFLSALPEVDEGSIGLAGYSFGAGVAIKAGLQINTIKALTLIGRARVDSEIDLYSRSSLPILFVVGDMDKLMPDDQLQTMQSQMIVPPEMYILDNADHFLAGREFEVGNKVANFCHRWLVKETDR
jgi:alpha/beta superfamily hydrolase